MMLLYNVCVCLILLSILFIILVNKGYILKKGKLRKAIMNKNFKYMLKKILLMINSLIIVVTITFLLSEMIETNTIKEGNILTRLIDYYYSILPVPKKVCSVKYLEGNDFVCSSYKYAFIDFKDSQIYMKNISVISIIKEKSLVSFRIGIIAYFLQCLIGYPLGIYLSKKENSFIDKSFNIVNTTIRITPAIIYFYLFVLLFMMVFKLPVIFEGNVLLTYIAPLTALTVTSSMYIAFLVRKYMIIEKNKDYVKYAISKGLSEREILYKHVARNALISFVRTIPISILTCFCGFYMLESSFNIPGIGLTLIQAIQLKDINLIRGIIIFFVFLSMVSFLIGDFLMMIIKEDVYKGKEENEDEKRKSYNEELL